MRRTILLVLVIALLAAACSGGDDAEDGQGADGGVAVDDGGAQTSDGDGSDDESSGTAESVDLPDELPIGVASGGDVFGVSESNGTYIIILEYPGDAFESVVAFFDAELEAEGFTVSSPFGNTDISASWNGERGSETLTMTAQGGENVIVSITYDSGAGG